MMTKDPGSNILMIDDSAQDVALLSAAFKESAPDHRMHSVNNADRAIAYFEGRGAYADRAAHPLPDLVLLDIQMPVKDGFEMLKWLRAQKAEWHRVPVIMLTTSHDYMEIRKAYDLGANSFLVKPTGFDELCQVVRELSDYWLKRNRVA